MATVDTVSQAVIRGRRVTRDWPQSVRPVRATASQRSILSNIGKQLEQAHQQAVKDLDNKINLCNAKLAAALSMAESQ